MCGENLNSSCLVFFCNSLFEVVFILNFTFVVFCYDGATVTLRLYDSVLIGSYVSCFQKVFTQFIMIPLMSVLGFHTWFLCSLRVSPQSNKKQDLRYSGLDQCIDSPTKSRTFDTLVLTSTSIFLQNVGLLTHSSLLV